MVWMSPRYFSVSALSVSVLLYRRIVIDSAFSLVSITVDVDAGADVSVAAAGLSFAVPSWDVGGRLFGSLGAIGAA